MNFSSMDYFVMVAKERSFTKAAEQLHITQQTLSAHIAGLEQELGSQLLVRHVPLELTYAGQVFLQYALDFQRKRHTLEQEFSDISSDQRGLLRIGIASTRGRAIMPALIGEFQALHPRIEIRLVESSNDMLRRSLINGEIDLAIANFPEVVPGVELRDFYQEEIVLLISHSLLSQLYGAETQSVVRKIEAGDLSPLQGCPFLLNSPLDIAGRVGRILLAQAEIIPTVKVESFNVETLLDLCARGAGACFSPGNLVKTALSEGQAANLKVFHFKQDTRYTIRFGYLKQAYRWSVIPDFIGLSQRLIPTLL